MRGQANLLALAIALLLLTSALGVGLALADAAFSDGQRDASERSAAVSLSDRLVSSDSPLTSRGNVLDAAAVDDADADAVTAFSPVVDTRPFTVRLDDRRIVEQGEPRSGTTISRIVLVENRTETTIEPELHAATNHSVTLPRRTPTATIEIDPPTGTTVETVRAGDRIVFHDPDGLSGTYDVTLSRFETVTLRFESTDSLPTGSVSVTYRPAQTRKATMEVTVGGA